MGAEARAAAGPAAGPRGGPPELVSASAVRVRFDPATGEFRDEPEVVDGLASAAAQALVVGTILLGAGQTAVAAAPPPTAPVAATGTLSDEQMLLQVVVLTNVERAAAGVAPLSGNPQLTLAAQSYADVMADTGCFGHGCGPVPTLSGRATAAGDARWGFLGENVAAGQPTPERAVAAWMASPTHRANLLNPEFTLLGVGQARGGVYGTYWTQEFGVPAAGVAVAAPAA